MAAAEAALRRVRRHPWGRLLEDDEDAAPKAPRADPHARQPRPEVPGGRRPRGRDSVRRARARARTRLQTRPGPQPDGTASSPAGARKARLRAHRGENPGSPDLVSGSRSLKVSQAGGGIRTRGVRFTRAVL